MEKDKAYMYISRVLLGSGNIKSLMVNKHQVRYLHDGWTEQYTDISIKTGRPFKRQQETESEVKTDRA